MMSAARGLLQTRRGLAGHQVKNGEMWPNTAAYANVLSVKNLSAMALFFWAFLLLPGLCGAGLLSHACANDESADCRHEEACAQDPCSVLTIRTVPTESARVPNLEVAVPPMAVLVIQVDPFSPPGRSLIFELPAHRNIPVRPTDLPFLI
jgi:hypothetical protein